MTPMNLNPRTIKVDEDDFDFDEMELLQSVTTHHSLDGLTTEEALSEGLLDMDGLPWEEERESRNWTQEEIEALDSLEF